MPLAIIHELTILIWLFFVQQSHRCASPNFTDPTASMPVQHKRRTVKALHRTNVPRPSINRIVSLRRERCGCSHRYRKLAIFAIVHEPSKRSIISVWIVTPASIAIEMPQCPIERSVRNISPALFGQQ